MADKNPIGEIKLPLTIKPDFFTYFLGGALSFIFWQPMLVTIVLGHWDWKLFVFCFGLTSGLLLLIHGCRIVIREKGLAYKRLFVWSRFIAFEEMKELKVVLGSKRGSPPYRLFILPHTKTREPVKINIKLFSRNGLSNLMKIIALKAPTACLDQQCEQMKERLMPSLLGDEKKVRSRSKILNFLLKER
jgi:hypothetical protein